MALGLNRNTPDYLWKMEAGRSGLEIGNLSRAGKYLQEIGKMSDKRWPKICLREELRGIGNNCSTVWGKQMIQALEELGDGESVKLILIEEKRQKLNKNLERNVKTKQDQEIQKNWGKIDKSEYCKRYGEYKKEIGMEGYWEKREWDGETKEQWARIRCGNIGKVEGKGINNINNMKCRICEDKEEDFEHIWKCDKAKKYMEREWVEEVSRRGLAETGTEWERRMIDVMKGDPIIEVCKYARKFEEIAKILDKERKEKKIVGTRN